MRGHTDDPLTAEAIQEDVLKISAEGGYTKWNIESPVRRGNGKYGRSRRTEVDIEPGLRNKGGGGTASHCSFWRVIL